MNEKTTNRMFKEKRWNRYKSGVANNETKSTILTVNVKFGLPSPGPGKRVKHIWYIKLMEIPIMAHNG